MPGKKQNYKKRNYKKRNYKRKGGNLNRIVHGKGDKEVTFTGSPRTDTVLYRGVGMPMAFITKLKANERILFNGASFNHQVYRANSARDPRLAALGPGCMWFPQLTAIYGRYCVLASKVQLTFSNNSSTQKTKVGVYPSLVSTAPANLENAVDRDNCTFAVLGSANGDQGTVSMEAYGKVHKMMGLRADEKQDDTLCADSGADPSRQCYWSVFVANYDVGVSCDTWMDITITYYVKFFNRIDQII